MRAESDFISKARAKMNLEGDRIATETKKQYEEVVPNMSVMLDKVIVRPLKPKRHHGSIALTEASIKAERSLTTVGQIVALGSQAYVATPDGLDYAADKNKISVGSWVCYRKHAGQPMRIKKNAEEKDDAEDQSILLIMEDRDILVVFNTEEDARMVWHWVGS